jgi:putative tryptophan/tyrosine transport system substrate-binding protein
MHFRQWKRREFMTLLGGAAAAWPLGARAQQRSLSLIGYLDPRSIDASPESLRAFRQGLRDSGFVEGQNFLIECRWAENQPTQLSALAVDLVRRQPAVIVTIGGQGPASAARAASTTIPIIFLIGEDPVRLGLVASISRPGGNLTGVNFFSAELVAKRLELLRALLPGVKRLAVLVVPNGSATESTLNDVEAAARAMALPIQVLKAGTSREIDDAFATLVRAGADALFVGADRFFTSRRVQLVQLAARHMTPATFSGRQFSEIGGLTSYGSNILEAYRQVGVYAARILRGARPSDLPVVQSNKFELVINHQTARMLGITVPDKLLATADEVIE